MPLAFRDHRQDPAEWARQLGVSRAAVDLYLASDVIDLHVDTYLSRTASTATTSPSGTAQASSTRASTVRSTCRASARRRSPAPSGSSRPTRSAPHRAAPIRWSATSPTFAPSWPRARTTWRSYGTRPSTRRHGPRGSTPRSSASREEARSTRRGHSTESPIDSVVRITLVHLYNSSLGVTSAPSGREGGLTPSGKEYVRALNTRRIFVDLAHIHRRGFFDAVEAHDKSLPLIVTHTGIAAVHEHWRNIDDEQLRAVAATGGTVGIMYHTPFLGHGTDGPKASRVVNHIEHVIKAVGDDHVSLGSDWDGAIVYDPARHADVPRAAAPRRPHAPARNARGERAQGPGYELPSCAPPPARLNRGRCRVAIVAAARRNGALVAVCSSLMGTGR